MMMGDQSSHNNSIPVVAATEWCGDSKRRRRRGGGGQTLKLMTAATACCYVLSQASSAVVVSAFQPYLPHHRSAAPSRLSRRQVVTDPTDHAHHLTSESNYYYSKRNAEIERLYRMSADEEQYYPHSELEWEAWLEKTSEQYTDHRSEEQRTTQRPEQQIQFKGLSTTARKRKGPRRKLDPESLLIDPTVTSSVATSTPRTASSRKAATSTASSSSSSSTPTPATTQKSSATTTRRSRSSTMPGFKALSDKQRAYEKGVRLAERRTGTKRVESEKAATKRTRLTATSMYINSASVPDSLVQFAEEIHAEQRISRQEEVELGTKTQAAIRLQNIYDVLRVKLNREPSDEEWCAAAGKINMASLRQTIEEGLDAKDKLVTSNLRMVQSVVNTYIRNGLSAKYNAGDLMQEGILALIRAAEKFEPDRGWKFSTYAMYWVRASVKRNQIYQSRVIALPQRMHENQKRLLRAEAELKVVLGRKPTMAEMGKAVGMSELQVERCLTAVAQKCYSLDQELVNNKKPTNSNSRGTLIELVASSADDGEQERTERYYMIQDLIETLHRHLTPEEVELLLLRYGLKESPKPEHRHRNKQLTIAELGTIVGQKPDKVRRTIKKSLKQLQSAGPEEWQEFQHALQ